MLLDEATINIIFQKSGPRLLFKSKYENHKLESKNESYSYADTDSSVLSGPSSSYEFTPDRELTEIIEIFPKSPEVCNPILHVELGPPMKKTREETVFVSAGGLENLLKNSAEGRIVLLHQHKLNNDLRQKLVKIVINDIISSNESNSFNIKADIFQKASQEICKLFPEENEETYYIPYTSSKQNLRRQPARGKLWSRFVNIRAALRLADTSATPSYRDKDNEQPIIEDGIDEKLNFLKSAVEPPHKIQIIWEESFKYRSKKYRTCPIIDIFNEFPCLKEKFGAELLESDFNQLFPEKIDIIYKHFPQVAEAILSEIKERKINLVYIGHDVDIQLQAILALPYLFSPVTLRKNSKDKNNWRPSRTEIQESFFFHLENYGQLHEHLERRKKHLDSFGFSLQPFGLAVGPLNSVDCYYVFINENQCYIFESPIRALEILCKVFHALNLEYPPESKHIWLFLQEIVFQTNSTSKHSSTACVLADITYHLKKTSS